METQRNVISDIITGSSCECSRRPVFAGSHKKTSLHSVRPLCTSQTAAAAGGGILQRSSNAIKLSVVPHSGLKLLSATNSESPSPTVAVWVLCPS